MEYYPHLCYGLVDAFAVSLLFGAFCARFRDVPQIIASVMQIAFFLTPIMWYANRLESNTRAYLLIRYNPFFYLLGDRQGAVAWDASHLV